MGEQQHKFTNHLVEETSPYLLQHAHNPVNWYPWGDEALKRAKDEDKPILVSIGYSACHWCHVMEHESFEDTVIAQFMNEHFINIKIDREERPDIDQIYMEAVQAMTGSGGWPLNCFLTPDAKPFYGGTYFPPDERYGRAGWKQVLESVAAGFQANRTKIEEQAENLTNHIANSDSNIVSTGMFEKLDPKQLFKPELLNEAFTSMAARFEKREGGFGNAPKFPNCMAIRFLFRYHHFTGNQDALDHALLSLNKMIRGGIYDQIGGGFARYSTDNNWLVPHFEKMLYDNALLMSVMAEAYKLTGDDLYRNTSQQTLNWIIREMTNEEGGFYSSLDADSEGEEGKFYVWQQSEINEMLGDDAEIFSAYFDVSEKGNWEHKNILNVPLAKSEFIEKRNISKNELDELIDRSTSKLLEKRETRIRPGLDDKSLLGWNAMMCSGLCLAYEAYGDEKYKHAAEASMKFILEKFRVSRKSDEMLHTYKNGKAQYTAFLDDYAFLVEALFDLYEINSNDKLLDQAQATIRYVQAHFYDQEQRNYFFTSKDQQDILIRKKEFYDNATPAGNSTMVHNLQRAAIYFGKPDYTEMANRLLASTQNSVTRYPTSFGRWANALSNYVYPISEIAVVGKDADLLRTEINKSFLPNKIIMASKDNSGEKYPLLTDKFVQGKTLIYICRNYACKFPVDNMTDFSEQIRDF